MTDIGPDQLDSVLGALGEQLGLANAHAHLVVIGGSGLVAIGAVARATQDVDVVALDEDGVLVSAEPLPDALLAAAALVARDFGLKPDWLNAGPTGLLEIGGLPEGFSDRAIRRDYGPALRVAFASRLDQVHLKLYAAVDRFEQRDVGDLRLLRPTADELRAAARGARTHNAPGPFDDALARTLSDFGVEDDGRDA